MGVTILHATAVIVPVLAGVILHFVGYQVPFFIACGIALTTVFVTRRLDPWLSAPLPEWRWMRLSWL